MIIDGEWFSFDECDNCGSVYLYFMFQDQMVGFVNVQGIGWCGIVEQVKGFLGRIGLLQGFYQCIFIVCKCNGEKEKIGGYVFFYVYFFLLVGEKIWEDIGLGGKDRFGWVNFDQGDSVLLIVLCLLLLMEV